MGINRGEQIMKDELKKITEDFHNDFMGLHNSSYNKLKESNVGMMFLYSMSDKEAKEMFERDYPCLEIVNIKLMNLMVAECLMYAVYFTTK